jgi:hypothetical protein
MQHGCARCAVVCRSQRTATARACSPSRRAMSTSSSRCDVAWPTTRDATATRDATMQHGLQQAIYSAGTIGASFSCYRCVCVCVRARAHVCMRASARVCLFALVVVRVRVSYARAYECECVSECGCAIRVAAATFSASTTRASTRRTLMRRWQCVHARVRVGTCVSM